MIDIPLIDELREIRRRMAEAQALDPVRYAAMLREVSKAIPGKYVDHVPNREPDDPSKAEPAPIPQSS